MTTKKINWDVKLKLRSFEPQTKKEVETLLLNLINNYFRGGRIEAK